MKHLKPFKMQLAVTPENTVEAEVIPKQNRLYEIWVNHQLLATAQQTSEGWHYLEQGKYPAEDTGLFIKQLQKHII